MNEIQGDLGQRKWPFLKFKMKKYIAAGVQGVDLSPEIPAAPSVAASSGGSLITATAYAVKVTFVIFDEEGREFSSIESEPSASAGLTVTSPNLTLSLTGIPLYGGSVLVKPATIHRRIYLSKAGGAYFLAKTLENNTATTTTIDADTSSTIEPPEFSMVASVSSEAPSIEISGYKLAQCSMEEIEQYDPGKTSSGTPSSYARIGSTRIFIYPAPSEAITLTYWVYRRPSRIFADTSRVLQLDASLRSALDLGVAWKGLDHKDNERADNVLALYEEAKRQRWVDLSETGGEFGVVRRVC